jgi:hypothetical protein
MDIEELISRLRYVRRTSRGWISLCTAHPDKNPSLSVREGQRGILLKCWAGCSLEAICHSLDIRVRDLFYDAEIGIDQQTWRQQRQNRQRKKQRAEKEWRAKGFQIDARREAERFLGTCRGVDHSKWSNDRFDVVLNKVCDALEIQRKEKENDGDF